MKLIDTKTNKPWPSDMANLKLKEIREVCRADLKARDEARGIEDGKVTTTIADPNIDGKTKEVVDPVKQAQAHTGAEFNALLKGRWGEYCSEPRDLEAFVASTKMPKTAELEAVREAAAPIEESLKADIPAVPGTHPTGESDWTAVEKPPEPAKPKGKPGRKPKHATADTED